MNWDQAAGQWKELKGEIKQQWGRLTENDIDRVAGKFDRFVGKIQQKYGIAKEEAQKQVNIWLSNFNKPE
jgi:uncharacterized protein YjbJ (UPF0337 family)